MYNKTSVLGIIFFAMALYYIWKSFEKQREVKACNGCRIKATIVDNKIQQIGAGINVYYAVYEYEMDGEVKSLQSGVPSASALNIGTHIDLYYNHLLRKPVEGVSSILEITLAIVFAIAATLLLNVN